MRAVALLLSVLFALGGTSPVPTSDEVKFHLNHAATDLANLATAKLAVAKLKGEAVAEAALAAGTAIAESASAAGSAIAESASAAGTAATGAIVTSKSAVNDALITAEETIVEATAPVVSVVSETAVSVGSNVAAAASSAATAASAAATNAAAAVSTAAEATADYVSSIDAIKVLNDTEKAVTNKKVTAIKTVFNAKRNLVKGAKDFASASHEVIAEIYGQTAANVDAAIAEASEAISATADTVASITSEITVENAEAAITATVDTASEVVHQTGNVVLDSLINIKKLLQKAATDFDSRKAIHSKHEAIGAALDYTAESAENLAETVGVFKAIDGLVKGKLA